MPPQDDRHIRSSVLPGGDLISAVLSREVMSFADRGSASNMVGDRWADVSAAFAASWPGTHVPIPGSDHRLDVERVVRLDDTPEVARLASKRHLQNPDFLLYGRFRGKPSVQAADAKFSIETARSKQVSPQVVTDLLELRTEIPGVFDPVVSDAHAVPGVFLSPDYSLTHVMLRRRAGIMRVTVADDEVVLVPVDPATFFQPLAGSTVMPVLAEIDSLGVSPEVSLLVGLYYFRLARAAVGLWFDATKPLLMHGDALVLDEVELREETAFRAVAAESAFGLIETWDLDVQHIRNQRHAVDQVAQLPVMNKELRSTVERIAAESGATPPSINQVRRRATAWWRGEIRDRVGPILPPVNDLPVQLKLVADAGRELTPQVGSKIDEVVRELIAAGEAQGDPSS